MKNRLLNYHPVIWFVLANRTHAVIYADKKRNPFYFVDRLINIEGDKSESDLVSDREGRVESSANRSIRHAYQPKESKHEHLEKIFARRIADYLDKAHAKKLYDQLILVAGPHLMGLLRNALKPAIQELIEHEIKHEYVRGSDAEIRKLILKAIPMSEGHINL